jgi:hypothetical protein
MLPQTVGSETDIKLPFFFFFFSLLALILSQTILITHGADFSGGHFRIPAIWSSAHLFILGWALMVAMGSMYQLVPVVFLTPIWSEKFGYFQFGILATGIISFSAFLYWSPPNALLPGLLTLLGILMFLFQMVMTLRAQTKPSILTAFVLSGLICLFFTIIFGISLIISWKTGLFADYYQAIFKSHLLLGVFGWFSLLIFGFSYKMVPMFSLSHGYKMDLAKYVFGTYVSGLILTIFSFFTEWTILTNLGVLLLAIGFVLFTWHISTIVKKRLKKKLDIPFMFSLTAIGFGLLIHLFLLICSFTGQETKLLAPLLFLYLMLWIVLSILGYLYKIVPFLWWTHKYSKHIGKQQVPALKDMIHDKLALWLLTIFIIACFVIYIGIIFELMTLAIIGILLLAASIILNALSILHVIFK